MLYQNQYNCQVRSHCGVTSAARDTGADAPGMAPVRQFDNHDRIETPCTDRLTTTPGRVRTARAHPSIAERTTRTPRARV
jgi:hypothetical protein